MNEEMKDLRQYEGFYRSIAIYNQAPDLSQRLFSQADNDPHNIQRIFLELIVGKKGDKYRAIGCAYNYAMVGAFLSMGETDNARQMLEFLVESDIPIGYLNQVLRDIAGTSYVDECLQQGKMLTSKQLDDVIFERWAPESKGISNTYIDKEGVAVVRQRSDSRYEAVLLSPQVKIRKISDSRTGIMEGEFAATRIVGRTYPCGTYEQLETVIHEAFRRLDVEDYCIVKTTDDRLVPYISVRMSLEAIAGLSYIV